MNIQLPAARAGRCGAWRRLAGDAAARLMRSLSRFRRAEGGTVLVELAIVTPVMLTMALGCVDITRYAMLHSKMQRAATTVADLIARTTSVTPADVKSLLVAADHVMTPYPVATRGVVLISAIHRTGTAVPKVTWQCWKGTGLPAVSDYGAQGANATLPSGITLDADETIIVSEVKYSFNSWFWLPLAPSATNKHYAVFRPRRGGLDKLSPPITSCAGA